MIYRYKYRKTDNQWSAGWYKRNNGFISVREKNDFKINYAKNITKFANIKISILTPTLRGFRNNLHTTYSLFFFQYFT